MTLYTSGYSMKQGELKKTALIYGLSTAFCGLFSVVYLHFSHGASSPFLVWLFAPPLLLGLVPALLLMRAGAAKHWSIPARRFWNSAVVTLSCGMLVRAIINISGRYTEYDTIYWIAAGVLFLSAILYQINRSTRAVRRAKMKQSSLQNASA